MLERIGIIFTKELTDNLRDRRVLLGALVYPLLFPLLMILILFFVGRNVSEQREQLLDLPVVGKENGPGLITFLEQNGVNVQEPPAEPQEAVRSGEVDLVLVIPPGYEEELQAARPATVRLIVDRSRQSSSPTINRAERLLQRYSRQIGALRLLARGISPSVTEALAVESVDISTPQSQTATLLSLIPYLLIFALFMGGMYLAIDTTTGERERGSLEPLLINPVPRWEFVIGKMGATLLFTAAAVLETLVAFGVLLEVAPISFPLHLGPAVLLTIFLITLPMMLLATALQMIIATFASGFKEAQTYISFVMLVPALPGLFLSFLPFKPSLWSMMIPTFGQQQLIIQVMRGDPIDPYFVLVSTMMTLIVAIAMVVVAIRLYDQERVLFKK